MDLTIADVGVPIMKVPVRDWMPSQESGPTGASQVGGDHYIQMPVQPWDAMQAWMSREAFTGFLRGNAIKYLARCDKKGGLEDLKKARHYIDRLIEVMEGGHE